MVPAPGGQNRFPFVQSERLPARERWLCTRAVCWLRLGVWPHCDPCRKGSNTYTADFPSACTRHTHPCQTHKLCQEEPVSSWLRPASKARSESLLCVWRLPVKASGVEIRIKSWRWRRVQELMGGWGQISFFHCSLCYVCDPRGSEQK